MKKKILIAVSLLALFIACFFAWKVFGSSVSTPAGKYFYINTGDDMETVKQKLAEEKIVSGTGWFNRVSSWLKYKTVKPGRYEIKKGTSLYNLVKMLRNGQQSQVKLVITKERTKEMFAGKIGKKYDFECDSLEMINFLNNNDSLQRFDVDTNTVMAIVMPYTYNINWNSTPAAILEQFYTT